MPYAKDFFSHLGDARPFKAGELEHNALAQADALLVRSTTSVGKDIIAMAGNLKFVGTATAGFDHLDIIQLKQNNIEVSVAAGCNAIAVAQYVFSALLQLSQEDNFTLDDRTVAIVGAGNTGTALSRLLDACHIAYILYDPPAQENGDARVFGSFEDVLQADIISLHTPLTKNVKYPTLHMFSREQLIGLRSDQYLVNACRGEVINNDELLALFQEGKSLNIVLDVWENEPNITTDLIPFLRFATAHIAGHTLEGKAKGTAMLYDALCNWIKTPPSVFLENLLPTYESQQPFAFGVENDTLDFVYKCCLQMYDIAKDDRVFRSSMAQSNAFKDIRRNYPERREYSALKITNSKQIENNKSAEILRKLGFTFTD